MKGRNVWGGMIVIVRQRWGTVVLLAVLLHLFAFGIAGFLLPHEESFLDTAQEITWLDVPEADETAAKVSPPREEKLRTEEEPLAENETLAAEEESAPEPWKPPSQEAVKSPSEAEKRSIEGQKAKPPKKRDYPAMRKPNKPAVLREETKRTLTETETAYRGHVQFFADISQEGRVTGVQAWQFEPEIADEKERRLLEERLEKRIKESWRYAPSLTPEGVATTQTKAEELDIPEKEKPKDDR